MPPIKVLIVEDNESTAFLISETLSSGSPGKYRIDIALRLKEACVKLASDPPDVVILDLLLPDTTGVESVTTISKLFPNIPIVVLTGQLDVNIAGHTAKQGALFFMQKTDIRQDRLENAVSFVMGEQERINELLETRDKIRASAAGIASTSAKIKEITGSNNERRDEQ